MKCHNCGHDNPAPSQVCSECQMPLDSDDAGPPARAPGTARRGSLFSVAVASALALGLALWLFNAVPSQDPPETLESTKAQPATAHTEEQPEPEAPTNPDLGAASQVVANAATGSPPSGESPPTHREPTPAENATPTPTSGQLDRKTIASTIRTKLPAVRDCYEQGLRRDPKLSGTVLLRFVISESGAVSSVDSKASQFPDPEVTSCVAKQIRGLVFPKPDGGPVTVNYPFSFRER